MRSARQKLGVTSSREAARLFDADERGHSFDGDMFSGVAADRNERQPRRTVFLWIGIVMAITLAAGVALSALIGGNRGPESAPIVVRTSPAAGSTVAPGPLRLSVTFDRPMQADSFSFVRKDPATYPDCGRNWPAQSKDGRTFTLTCTLEPNRAYEIWFNSPPYMNFRDRKGQSSAPFQLKFWTRAR